MTILEQLNTILKNNVSIALFAFAILNLAVIIFLSRIYKTFKGLEDSFTKLGHIAREDTKKYFDDAAEKAIRMHQSSVEENKKIISAVNQDLIDKSSDHLKKVLTEGEKEAIKIISEAQENSIEIKKQAEQEAKQIYENVINESSQAIDWALKQFIKENFTIEDHEELIKKLIKIYRDENRRY